MVSKPHVIHGFPGEACHKVGGAEARGPYGVFVVAGHNQPPLSRQRVLHVDHQGLADVQ